MDRMSLADWASWILATVGALNWGLVGLANVNLVEALFGRETFLSRVIYALVGVSGVWSLYRLSQTSGAPATSAPLSRIFGGD